MSTKSQLQLHQFDWATTAACSPDIRGYLASYELNLFQPLSKEAHRAFTEGSGSELLPKEGRPAKMAALHSSSALAVNAFDYWAGKPLSSIASALGIEQTPANLRFEAQFPTGLGGTPPNLDLAFTYPNGHILGVESKFSEWLTPKPSNKQYFKEKYFQEGKFLWTQAGLPNTQELADRLQKHEQVFRHLDAAQLLKHMLGLATAAPGQTSLYYIYYDCPGQESSIHRSEIEEFASLIGKDMKFYWASYQQFFGRLRTDLGDSHQQYMNYVTERYCRGGELTPQAQHP